MSLKHLADNIAAHGRHGDDTLIHVDKSELAALKALANKHGKPLTTNPHTGLPEAFGLRQLLPVAAGLALGPAGVGMSAMGAGLTVGGVSALASGNLKQGMMDGLGAWGGAGLGAAPAPVPPATPAVPPVTPTPITPTPVTPTPVTPAGMGGAGGLSATTTGYGTLSPTATGASGLQTASGTNLLPSSTANFTASSGANALPSSAADFTANAGMNTAASTGTNAVTQTGVLPGVKDTFSTIAANAEANPRYLAAALAPAVMDDLTPKPKEQAARQGDADMGQRYEYQPSSQYSAPSYKKIGNEEARKLYGYAEGGDVQYPYSEPVVRMYGGGNTGEQINPGLEALVPPHLKTALRGPVLKAKGPEEEPVRMAAGGDAGKHKAIIDSFNRDYGAFRGAALGASAPFVDGQVGGAQQAKTPNYVYHPGDQTYERQMAGGGLSSLGGYSDGGRLLKGPGDGMSDNIPAQIGQKQPARLADGEFVVPADVVSHLGNGSTDAGAKQLYKMMDRIRAARTGNKRQGKQINPNKFTPA